MIRKHYIATLFLFSFWVITGAVAILQIDFNEIWSIIDRDILTFWSNYWYWDDGFKIRIGLACSLLLISLLFAFNGPVFSFSKFARGALAIYVSVSFTNTLVGGYAAFESDVVAQRIELYDCFFISFILMLLFLIQCQYENCYKSKRFSI